VLKADREELRRASRTDEVVLDEATALIQQMDTDDLTARFEIRQRLHIMMRRIVEVARFGTEVAEVDIRGGYRLTIPLDKAGEAKVQIVRGGFGLFTGPEHNGVPVLTPDEHGVRLVAATMKPVGRGRYLRTGPARTDAAPSTAKATVSPWLPSPEPKRSMVTRALQNARPPVRMNLAVGRQQLPKHSGARGCRSTASLRPRLRPWEEKPDDKG
jgi:hypothetical protein